MVDRAQQDRIESRPGADDTWSLDLDAVGSKAEKIVSALRRAIVTLRLKPGMSLSEQEIADRFGVSRQPVREAFIRLSGSGLIVIRPQRATRVARISLDAIDDAHFVRQAFELEIVRLAAGTASSADIAGLEAELRRQRQAGRERDAGRFFDLDEQFHRRLAAVAGRPNAWRAIEDAKAQLDRVRYLTLLEERPLRQRIEDHETIVAAIVAHKPAAAVAAMRVHLSGMKSLLPKLAGNWPDLFAPPQAASASARPREA
jgi:DNA-binding GntR family transcriptional regulator